MKNIEALVLYLVLLLINPSVQAVTVYSNDFNSGAASLSDFIVGGKGSYSVNVVSGQLRINTYIPIPCYGYAAIHSSNFMAPYSSRLKDNPGLVSWAFNVSNQSGEFNNGFYFTIASSAANSSVYTTAEYTFAGGGYVGNEMVIYRNSPSGSHTRIIRVQSGLPTLPSRGSIRITYDPSGNIWSLYGEFGSSYVDPTSVTTLLGSNVDNVLTGLDLPFMSLGGRTTGTDYFDNVSVSVVPEPPTLLLLGMAAVMVRRRGINLN